MSLKSMKLTWNGVDLFRDNFYNGSFGSFIIPVMFVDLASPFVMSMKKSAGLSKDSIW